MLRTALLLTTLLVGTDVSAQESLRAGSSVRGSLAEGDTVAFTIDAGADYFVLGEVEQRSVDVVVRVLDPEGRALGRVGNPDRGPAVFSFETKEAGRYRIEVFPDEDEVGDFQISLDRLEAVETDPKKLADQLMSRYDRDDSPGAAVSVWRDGRTIFSNAYGMANLAYDIPFEVDTRTNIGSTSKQFTAFAILLQAERGELSLDDDIRTHIPELREFDEVVTIRHLITHTSGLREFLNLLLMSGRQLDHGDHISRDELIDVVNRQPALQNAPGAEWNYNNTAFGLAAAIVERTSGQDFHVFMAENVFGPLDMIRTMVRPTPEHIVEGRSMGYTPSSDGFLEVADIGGAVGAGGIYSTVEDLQTWVENYASMQVGDAEIFQEMMTSYVLTDGEETGYGYGLFIDEQRGLKRVHHGGADIAHRSMLAYYPEINAGITVQSNHSGFDTNVAFRIAAAFFDEEMEPDEGEVRGAVAFDPAAYDSEDFDEMVGRYALDDAPTVIMTFTREEGTLYAQLTGQPRTDISPTSDSTFAWIVVEASVAFHRNDAGEVDGATLNQNGQQLHATQLEEDGAEAWEPTGSALTAFEGRYFSLEIETFYTATVQDEQLVIRQLRIGDTNLTPGEEDTFTSGGGMAFSFERDRNGQVIGFYLSNGRTRDVRFERVR